MKFIKVAGGVVNQTPLDWKGNTQRLRQAMQLARSEKVSVLCLPELAISGYGCEDAFYSPFVIDRAWEALRELTPESSGMIVSLGLPVFHKGALFNATAVLCDGRLVGLSAKKNLAGDGVYYEQRWFKAWPVGIRDTYVNGSSPPVPIGDLHFDFGGVRIGLEICEEAWVASRPGIRLSREGVDIILNPSASHFAFGKTLVRERFVVEGSRAFGVAYVYTNLLGNEAGRIIFDGGVLIASEGALKTRGPRLGFEEVSITCAIVDVAANRAARARTGSFQPLLGQHADATSCSISSPMNWPKVKLAEETAMLANPGNQPAPWEYSKFLKEEEFARAVSLGLFDYLRKSRSHGFVVSLSGGVDSAAVAVLSAMSLHMAEAQLGWKNVQQRLAYIPKIKEAHSSTEAASIILFCAYQATENSSDTTKTAARSVALALSAFYREWSVEGIKQQYEILIEQALDRKLTWKEDDVALQNIQARSRAPGIWLLTNVKNALLLSTSNRSEAAVGYATMDGDTCGGLSPIAGIDKNYLRHWIFWMQTQGPLGLFSLPALEAVTQQAPTAELRPLKSAQTDESDLMPYDVLDVIERAAIRDKRSPLESFEIACHHFPQQTPAQVRAWVVRFFRLWTRNQWKRERYAPSFHLDDESLDPKYWCRFPILSGGFSEEIENLESLKI
jgi:NAD+ synthase (glutamine-hydrolysing)